MDQYSLFAITIRRYVFICIIPLLFSILSNFFKVRIINKIFSWFGSISLELYLIHVVDRPVELASSIFSNRQVSILVAFTVCALFAFIIHQIFAIINKELNHILIH